MALVKNFLDVLRQGIARTWIIFIATLQIAFEKQLGAGLLNETLIVRLNPLYFSTTRDRHLLIRSSGTMHTEVGPLGEYLLRLRDHLNYGVEIAMR